MKLISLQLLLCFTFSSTSSSFSYRELLSLKALHRKNENFERSYIVQRIIWLFGQSDDSALVLLRDTILDNVIEEEMEVVRQGTAYSEMVTKESNGMMSGLYKKLNGGLELSMEIQIIFQGTGGLSSIKKFMGDALNDHFSISSCEDKSVKKWQLSVLSEAVMAWKQFSTNYEFIPSGKKIANALNSKQSQFDCRERMGERMSMHLNNYERFLKPTVHQFDLGFSYAIIMTVYYYFQYLHQISRIFAVYITSGMVDRLKREHEMFIKDTSMFLKKTSLQRTLVGSFPFEGRWLFNTELGDGILVPNTFKAVELVVQYRTHMPLLKVSLYRVNLKHEQEGKSSPGCVRLQVVDQNYLGLTIHTVRANWDQVWLGNLVKRLNRGCSKQSDILNMIYS